jgi:hypothetical protein
MGASKDSGVGDSRAVYSPPCVVKINDLKQSSGQSICATGSGDALLCCTGNTAGSDCISMGNSAGFMCSSGSSGACPKHASCPSF